MIIYMSKILSLIKVFLQSFLKGKLTYITGFAMIIAAILGYTNDSITLDNAVETIGIGLGLLGIRRSIGNV